MWRISWASSASTERASHRPAPVVTLPSIQQGNADTLTSLEQARRIADVAHEKLARDVVILDMRPVCIYTDFFVVCTGQNTRQTRAIHGEVHDRLKADERLLPRSVDGEREGAWIVADYLDVVFHVFTPEARAYYRLEDLWGDVPSEAVEAAAR